MLTLGGASAMGRLYRSAGVCPEVRPLGLRPVGDRLHGLANRLGVRRRWPRRRRLLPLLLRSTPLRPELFGQSRIVAAVSKFEAATASSICRRSRSRSASNS
jgi:hypothetical protein